MTECQTQRLQDAVAELQEENARLRQTIADLLGSADCSWESGKHGGHDWPEAVKAARAALGALQAVYTR